MHIWKVQKRHIRSFVSFLSALLNTNSITDKYVEKGAFTGVGWQVTLCDTIGLCQVTSRSSEVGIPQEELHWPLPLLRFFEDSVSLGFRF